MFYLRKHLLTATKVPIDKSRRPPLRTRGLLTWTTRRSADRLSEENFDGAV